MSQRRIFVSVPESLVSKPLIYEIVKRFDVVPNLRRADVEEQRGWMILELGGEQASQQAAIDYLVGEGCIVDDMTGDIVAG